MELALSVCHADSAGLSVLMVHKEQDVLRWRALAGSIASRVGRPLPRDASPCGYALARNTVALFDRPQRAFPVLDDVRPAIHEQLVAPWQVHDVPMGTLWVMGHDAGRHFDAEDARVLDRLSRFAAVGWQVELLRSAERRRAASISRESEERLRLIVNSVNDYAIITTDLAGIITSWNRGAERIFGFTPAEALRRHVELIFTPEDRRVGAPRDELRRAAQRGRAEDERWHIAKDGRRLYLSGVLTPLRSDDQITGYVKVARDTTDRMRTEESLREARNDLEDRVRERTAELVDLAGALQIELREREAAEVRIKSLFSRVLTVQEDERRRIAREIHDQVGQQITALRMGLDALGDRLSAHPEIAPLVQRAADLARDLDTSIDFLTWDLRPTTLDDLGLRAGLAALVRGWSARLGIHADYHDTGMD